MKNELSTPVVYSVVAVVLIAVIAIGFVLLRDKTPTKTANPVGRDKLGGAPPPSAPPAWAMEKFRAAQSGSGR